MLSVGADGTSDNDDDDDDDNDDDNDDDDDDEVFVISLLIWSLQASEVDSKQIRLRSESDLDTEKTIFNSHCRRQLQLSSNFLKLCSCCSD